MRTVRMIAVLASFVVAGITGCASTRPPQELVDARAAYARAYEGPAAQANVAGLTDAKRVLDQAEEKFADDPHAEEVRHLAYVAHRRILIAETNARTSIASAQRAQAEQAVAHLQKENREKENRDQQQQQQQQKARTVKP